MGIQESLNKIKDSIAEIIEVAYDKGVEATKNDAKCDNCVPKSSENLVNKIDSMARQVEESHAALRRRNETIKALEKRITKLERDIIDAKIQNYGEARAEAWYEGWKHDSDFTFRYGQPCQDENCNPYKKCDND